MAQNMEITEQELFDYLTGNKKGNIALYDQILTLTKKRNYVKPNKR